MKRNPRRVNSQKLSVSLPEVMVQMLKAMDDPDKPNLSGVIYSLLKPAMDAAKTADTTEGEHRAPLGKATRRMSAAPGTACRDGAHCPATV